MQSYGFKNEDLTHAERLIFKFLWSTSENPNGIDRIKRSIMKNEYSKGGMKVTDVECLDRSLKLKQFVRACSSKHEISKIQNLLTNGKTMESNFKQEYAKITNSEPICKSAQETLNIIIDHNRDEYVKLSNEECESDRNLIDEVSSINLKTYLSRKNKMFMLCILKKLNNAGITTLAELIQAEEHTKDKNLIKAIKLILSTIPKKLIDIASN